MRGNNMSRNESCDLKTALEFCILAKEDKENAALHYYQVTCITDNAIMKRGRKHNEALKNLTEDQKSQLAFAYYYIALNPNQLVPHITNPADYFYAAVKLKMKLMPNYFDQFMRLTNSSITFYEKDQKPLRAATLVERIGDVLFEYEREVSKKPKFKFASETENNFKMAKEFYHSAMTRFLTLSMKEEANLVSQKLLSINRATANDRSYGTQPNVK